LQRIKDEGLPCYQSIVLPLNQYLLDPSAIMNEYAFPLYWISLLPLNHSVMKRSAVNITADQAEKYIRAANRIVFLDYKTTPTFMNLAS
jgi:hypothetical protein